MNKKITVISTLLCLLFQVSAFCETIALKSGKTIEAKIIEKTGESIKVDISGIPVTYYLDDIESIDGVKETPSSMGKNSIPTGLNKAEETFVQRTGDNDKERRDIVDNVRVAHTPNENMPYGLLVNRGVDCLKKGDYDQAIFSFTKAIEINPNLPEAYFNRGAAYVHKKNYEQAIADCTKAIEINPNCDAAYLNRGIAYFYKKSYDQAISDLTKAIEINPNYDLAYSCRGGVYYEKLNYEQAITDCTKAIEINPNNSQAYNNRGLAYFYGQKNFTQAWEDVHKAKSLGYKIDPGFIADLKKASGRDK